MSSKRSAAPPFEHGNLLSKGKNFKGRLASVLAEDADDSEYGQNDSSRTNSLL